MELRDSKLKRSLKKTDMKELMFYKDSLLLLREQLVNQLGTLKDAIRRCEESIYSLLRYREASSAEEALVPLTGQLFVWGRVASGGVLVGLGAGLLARLSTSAALGCLRRQGRALRLLRGTAVRRLAAGEVALDTIAREHAVRILADIDNNNKVFEYLYSDI